MVDKKYFKGYLKREISQFKEIRKSLEESHKKIDRKIKHDELLLQNMEVGCE